MAPRTQTQRAVRVPNRTTATRNSRVVRRQTTSLSTTQPRRHRQEATARSNPNPNNRYFGCGICKADHRIVTCKKFLDQNLAQKYKTVLKLHYCTNCLARNHLVANCTNTARCRVCGLKHHTMLHGHQRVLTNIPTEARAPTTTRRSNPRSPAAAPATSTALGVPSTTTRTLVPTVEVYGMTEEGCVSIRAILNPSSTLSRIAASFVRDNKLRTFNLDGQTYVKLTITPNMNSLIKYDMCWLVTNELPKQPYTNSLKESIKDKVEHIALADPNFNLNEPVFMELGGDLYASTLKPNTIHIDGGSLLAQDSTFGWLIMGSFSG